MRVLLLLSVVSCLAAEEYQLPHPKFSLLQPKGFSVSIPDEHGIQLFAFHGNINKDMQEKENGQISGDIIAKSHGKWVYKDKHVKLQEGDVMNYWIFVLKNGRGYIGRRHSYTWKAEDFKKAGKKSLYHSIKKRHTFHSRDYPKFDDNNEYGYMYPNPYHMRPHKFDPYSHNTRFHEKRPHGYGSFYHNHHGHFNCNQEFDYDDETTTIKVGTTEAVTKITTTTPTTTIKTEPTPPKIDIRFGE